MPISLSVPCCISLQNYINALEFTEICQNLKSFAHSTIKRIHKKMKNFYKFSPFLKKNQSISRTIYEYLQNPATFFSWMHGSNIWWLYNVSHYTSVTYLFKLHKIDFKNNY